MAELRTVVAGASGRMGKALLAATLAHPELKLVGALEREGAETVGQDAGLLAGAGEAGVAVSDDPIEVLAHCDALIDFTLPDASLALLELAAQARIVHVIGTTGFAPEDETKFRAAARHCRIVKSGNMSVGVNLVAGLVRRAAAALGPDFDIEILEMHHRHKVDAPSGTALLLGEAAAEGRGIALAENAVRVRDGHTGPRPEGKIGFATLRGGSVVGEHSVILAGEGEWIEIAHHALDRSIYTRGALKAALWAFDKKPGLYHMADVLGLH
ncbi:4-hydroxy-tetrahydrodipicolinate reductase [Afifella pfennigii]|uniref:4-hydroxy-tetrahydrodipicolinate reductase n=1 Tax=Afifella pfennigii TaxID=209897 RepID=UPI0004795E87|nr:4-hydroxy-tetrahydrodipicolinate reductase [Afifella pfennigii]